MPRPGEKLGTGKTDSAKGPGGSAPSAGCHRDKSANIIVSNMATQWLDITCTNNVMRDLYIVCQRSVWTVTIITELM